MNKLKQILSFWENELQKLHQTNGVITTTYDLDHAKETIVRRNISDTQTIFCKSLFTHKPNVFLPLQTGLDTTHLIKPREHHQQTISITSTVTTSQEITYMGIGFGVGFFVGLLAGLMLAKANNK